jgi:peptidoglycan/xylan/chitin deacetylase (PgdA/CDA1 family)
VLNYHRIGDVATTPLDEGVFSATPSEFEAQISLVRRRCGVVSLDEALDLLEGSRGWSGVPALITFDDGYLDNYQVAFPILKSLSVPAVFFLVSSFVGGSEPPWWDRIAWIVRNARQDWIQLQYPQPLRCELGSGRRSSSIRQVLRLYRSPACTNHQRFMRELMQACGVIDCTPCESRLFLDWNEAREMLCEGMAIGSHTHTHRVLAKLSRETQLEELSRSKAILQGALGADRGDIRTLAYPVGGPADFSEETRWALEQAGYRAAFSYYGGINHRATFDRFDLRRVSIEAGTPSARFRMQLTIAPLANGYWF